ncbi:MAG TPA: TadE family type IV pilus minor pilin [Pilimelia sp.]|nr:TadE family type IV pilus minor pilin [Pilimelia sp.]
MRWAARASSRARPAGSASGDGGFFTAEFAAGIPALVLLVGVGLSAVHAVHTRLWCLDAARAAALAAARGAPEPPLSSGPSGVQVERRPTDGGIWVRISAPVAVLGTVPAPLRVSAEVTAALEPGVAVRP